MSALTKRACDQEGGKWEWGGSDFHEYPQRHYAAGHCQTIAEMSKRVCFNRPLHELFVHNLNGRRGLLQRPGM